MADFADLKEPLIIARGAASFQPDPQYGIRRQDLGEADVSTTDETTYTEVYSRRHLVRTLLSRTVNQRTQTIDITCYQKRKIVQFLKNLSKPTEYVQLAGTDVAFPADVAALTKVSAGQIENVGKVGIYDVDLGALVVGEDYAIVPESGDIQFLKDIANVDLTAAKFSHIAYTGEEYAIADLPEVRGILTIVPVSEDDQEGVVRSFYAGIAPNGQIREISGDDGEVGWTFQGRVYSNPYDTSHPNGKARSLPSFAAIDAVANP